MREMPKILLVCEGFLPIRGGVQEQVNELAKQMRLDGHYVKVATCTPQLLDDSWLTKFVQLFWVSSGARPRLFSQLVLQRVKTSVEVKGVNIRTISFNFFERLCGILLILTQAICEFAPGSFASKRQKVLKDFLMARSYRRLLESVISDVDVVHVHLPNAFTLLATEIAKRQGKVLAFTAYIHPNNADSENIKIQRKRIFEFSDLVFSLTPCDTEAIRSEQFAGEIVEVGVLPNKEYIEKVQAVGPSATSQPRVLLVARIGINKGVPEVVEAAKIVWKFFPETKFVFCGPDNESLAKNLFDKKDPRIIYMGEVDDLTKFQEIAKCDVFCLPSLEEIFPVAIAEAWSYGKPVISGPARSVCELVARCEGGLVINKNAKEIAEAILRILKDPELKMRLGSNGRKTMETTYSREVLAARHTLAYAQAVERTHK